MSLVGKNIFLIVMLLSVLACTANEAGISPDVAAGVLRGNEIGNAMDRRAR